MPHHPASFASSKVVIPQSAPMSVPAVVPMHSASDARVTSATQQQPFFRVPQYTASQQRHGGATSTAPPMMSSSQAYSAAAGAPVTSQTYSQAPQLRQHIPTPVASPAISSRLMTSSYGAVVPPSTSSVMAPMKGTALNPLVVAESPLKTSPYRAPPAMTSYLPTSADVTSRTFTSPASQSKTTNSGVMSPMTSALNHMRSTHATSSNVTYMSVSRPIVSIETSPKAATHLSKGFSSGGVATQSIAIPSSLIPRPIVSFTSASLLGSPAKDKSSYKPTAAPPSK